MEDYSAESLINKVLLDKICAIARELGTGNSGIDLEVEGFSYTYVDDVVSINWCSAEDEIVQILGLKNGIFVGYRGRNVLSKLEDSIRCEVYIAGEEWEQHINTLYQTTLSLKVVPDDNFPF